MEYLVKDNKYNLVKQVLINEFNFSKRLILKLKQENKIYVNNIPCFVNHILVDGDIVKIDLNFEENCDNIVPLKMNLNIIYEDDWLIILNKPAKIETHPTVLNNTKTLSNGLKSYFDSINLKRKIRPVNRLDKDTSGIIIFAKNQYIQEELVKQMKSNIFEKQYIAIVEGFLENEKGEIEASIARKKDSILERCVDNENGAFAKTYYEVIRKCDNYKATIVKIKLETGRTHQIRVHMSYIGHSLVGDFLYGKKSELIDRQALHSWKVQFIHPISRELMCFEAELPEDMKKLCNQLSL